MSQAITAEMVKDASRMARAFLRHAAPTHPERSEHAFALSMMDGLSAEERERTDRFADALAVALNRCLMEPDATPECQPQDSQPSRPRS